MALCQQKSPNSNSTLSDTCSSPHRSDSSIPDEFPPNYDDISLIKLLNKAKFSVYSGYSSSADQQFAVKFFPFQENKVNPCFLNEIHFANLRHDNVISTLHYEPEREAAFSESTQLVSYIIMELAPYGDFFDAVMSDKIPMTEKLARTYFHQLLEGLEYLHSVGVSHLDLKLDNLLLGQDYTLKIADFDQAFVKGMSHIYSKGTVCYRAPELAKRKCLDTEAADIYSAGIILFLLKCKGTLPYSEDKKFRGLDLFTLMVKRPNLFWEKHCEVQRKDPSFFDEEFKSLFMSMVKYNPQERMSIKQIKSSKWYNGPTYSKKELVGLMRKYY